MPMFVLRLKNGPLRSLKPFVAQASTPQRRFFRYSEFCCQGLSEIFREDFAEISANSARTSVRTQKDLDRSGVPQLRGELKIEFRGTMWRFGCRPVAFTRQGKPFVTLRCGIHEGRVPHREIFFESDKVTKLQLPQIIASRNIPPALAKRAGEIMVSFSIRDR
jgi:hypothetical protein